MNDAVSNLAAGLYGSALVWDNHACPAQHDDEDFGSHMRRFRAAGVNVLSLNIGDSDVSLEEVVRNAARIRRYLRDRPNEFVLIRRPDDIRLAHGTHRLAILFDIEGCYAVGDQLSLIPLFFDIGVRWMALVYNRRNLVGSGVHDEHDEGLTAFGRQLVVEMDRVGMIKCCSHTGYRTAMDVFAATAKPTIFSHSNVRALRDHPRNIPDELIKACAATGGVVGLSGVGIFLGDNDVRTETLVRHIDYVAQLVGPRHVALGLDTVFDQSAMDAALAANSHIWPAAFGYRPGIRFLQPEQLRELPEALLRLGYSDDGVRGVLGENLLRVAGEVWPA